MDLQLTEETFGSSNWDWLASAQGTEHPHSVTLDTSLLIEGTHFPDGHLISGTLLAKVTAGGLWAPYVSDAVDGRQTAVAVMLDEQPIRTNESGAVLATRVAVAAIWSCQVNVAKMPGLLEIDGTTAHPIVAGDLPAGVVAIEL